MKKLPKPYFIFREREGPEETCYTKAQTEGYGFESRRVGRLFSAKCVKVKLIIVFLSVTLLQCGRLWYTNNFEVLMVRSYSGGYSFGKILIIFPNMDRIRTHNLMPNS